MVTVQPVDRDFPNRKCQAGEGGDPAPGGCSARRILSQASAADEK